jgi:hypothetical protein
MQIDRMTLALRPRSPWEGADLGVVMLRAWARPVYAAMIAIVIPVALAAHLLLGNLFLALLVVWWLKPLYDRVVLHVMARALFGATPSLRETLADIPSLLRGTGLLGALTLRRLDPARSFNLPVRQLEHQAGAEARSRERLLGRRTSAQTTALLYCCIAFETIAVISAAALLELLTPASIEADLGWGAIVAALFGAGDAGSWHWINNALFIVAYCIVEPLYVAAGFALYLNRRTSLEAWDLELRFRRLQLEPGSRSAHAAMLLAAVLVCMSSIVCPETARAAQSSREIIREVLAAPEFQQRRTQKVWQPRDRNPQQADRSFAFDLTGWLHSLSGAAAQLLRVVAYAALAYGLFIALRFLLAQLRSWNARTAPAPHAPNAPEVLFGLDVRPEALPANLAQLAAEAAAIDPRLALSLLYRGALVTLIHRDRMHIAHGDTETDCLRRVQATRPDETSAYFARLVAAWSQTAYGHRPPETSSVAELCAQWPRHFRAEAAP